MTAAKGQAALIFLVYTIILALIFVWAIFRFAAWDIAQGDAWATQNYQVLMVTASAVFP